MKKAITLLFGILILCTLLLSFRYGLERKVSHDFMAGTEQNRQLSPTPFEKVTSSNAERESVFVPYWTVGGEISGDEDRYIYFGVSPTINGINRNEDGFRRMQTFTENVEQGVTTLLTLRMLSQDTNFEILEDPDAQERVIDDTISVAKANGFDGIVLDLELKALPFDSVVDQINGFVSRFYKASKAEGMTFAVATYGDTFYRIRPFDVKTLGENSDEIMIMAYDFHKSGGNPGPNFPLSGKDEYGYDYYEMMDDYLAVVPSEKLTVIFGMFGYNWTVDEKNSPVTNAVSLSFLQGQSRYLQNCNFTDCRSFRDERSGEMTVTYVDNEKNRRIVWFEDEESVERKKELLRERGINSFSYWAYTFY